MLIPKCKGDAVLASVPREATFTLPEGNYTATIDSVRKFTKQTGQGAQEWVRFLFDVDIPSRGNFINKAGRSFKLDLNNGSDLRNFLTTLLGRNFFSSLSGKQIALDGLKGTKCEIPLRHVTNSDYENPLVVVDGCYPVGALKLTEEATPEKQEGEPAAK